MNFIVAVILGIVEGLTEFIPVSSTGHMILTAKLLGYDDSTPEMKTFMIVIQLGAILAISWVYRERIIRLLGLSKKPVPVFRNQIPARRLDLLHVILGIVPALAVGFFFRDFIKSLFSPQTVLWALLVGGIFMIAAEWYSKNKARVTAKDIDQLTHKQALLIGLYQCISVLWPGFSRSGSTIAGGMFSGASYKASADFSFLIAIPIMFAVSGYEMLDSYRYFTIDTIGLFAVGFIVSFIVAYIVVMVFLKSIQKIQLRHFAYYRFLLAALFWTFIMQ
ncbi:undecaprenyl-diphosphate phosphatase [Paenibacillus woosongensis]|uniref:Undecaprenyl-diphosphatase n=1 Tax=Paenibacillus woosongensis TaxID=307580 RepID=A0AA95I7I9_9BACL|nr:undecaprenyl-diphosphate phosphatase [Paenibacillus woosongensis]WHX50656.1 undecaprenyl-diphosphate phosphatase [Paenibacillus woosongensis]